MVFCMPMVDVLPADCCKKSCGAELCTAVKRQSHTTVYVAKVSCKRSMPTACTRMVHRVLARHCTDGKIPVVHRCQAVIAFLSSSVPAKPPPVSGTAGTKLHHDARIPSSQLPHSSRCASNEPSFCTAATGNHSPNFKLDTELRNRFCQEGCTHCRCLHERTNQKASRSC
jgi:hypothetical protein